MLCIAGTGLFIYCNKGYGASFLRRCLQQQRSGGARRSKDVEKHLNS